MVAMDPIIRLAQVSSVARRIGRPAPALAPMPETVSEVAPEVAPDVVAEVVPAVVPAIACGCADALAHAEHEHVALLARRDAEIDTLREAAQLAAVELTDAYADAEERGHAAGVARGEATAGAAMQAQVERLKSLAEEIGGALRTLSDTAEDLMIEMVFTAICRILGERGASRDAVQDVVRMTMGAMREREHLVVRLHPDDAVLLEESFDGAVRIDADRTVVLGGCIVDSPGGSLDARFDTQLDALRAALSSVRSDRRAALAAA